MQLQPGEDKRVFLERARNAVVGLRPGSERDAALPRGAA
jgi:hypothetical protein